MDRHLIVRTARLALVSAAAATVVFCTPMSVSADPSLRTQMDIAGDFVLLGNTLVQECAFGAPSPIVGDVNLTFGSGGCPNSNLAAPDVFWSADDATASAQANSSVTNAQASSASTLVLPAGAQVEYARLYWSALITGSTADPSVRLARSSSGLDQVIAADDSIVLAELGATGRSFYQSTADVTDLVIAEGPGSYLLSGVDANLNSADTSMAAWYMVVFYRLDGATPRNLAIFDGLDFVDPGNPSSATLSGFLVPNAGFDARLGVVALEGEDQLGGDALSFNGTDLSNAQNPVDNFFNASRTLDGAPVTVVGDLPQLSGAPQSMSNMDLDIVDVTSRVSAGDSSADIAARSSIDKFVLSAFVTSISTLVPDFTTSTKGVIDVDGGEVFRGDTLEYTITVRNSGSDASERTVLTDPLPVGVTFVPGSISIAGVAQTDGSGDDQADYDAAARTLTARLGNGATAALGGALEIGDQVVVTFQVTVDGDAPGEIENQGLVTFIGRLGAPETVTATDSDATVPGQSPIVVIVSCQGDDECSDPTPFCDLAGDPSLCVTCATSAQCTDPAAPDCNLNTNQCECSSPDGMCVDTDGDGISDSGEEIIGTDPMDPDTDDDGVPDGAELGADKDSDGDGLNNPLDPDSDNDALPDGTEMGFGCDNPGTDLSQGNCRPDGDMGATITNPVKADTDGGGARDGSEDGNLNGVVDSGEQDPTLGHPEDDKDIVDSDDDGLSNPLEETIRSDPQDADTDNDGLQDGEEPNPGTDVDGDGLSSVLDVDSDDDGLLDGTEAGKDCAGAATNAAAGHCRADGDLGATVTSVLNPDTDGGGVSDGSEDVDLNGVVDPSETNPVVGQGADDQTVVDTDSDGLSDGVEDTLGSDPMDADTDDDGVRDGREPNPSDDGDGDGKINVLDPDSDDDLLFDGTELGLDCGDSATKASAATCIADADMGVTTTSPLNADTDYGTRPDGAEDADHNGRIDADETDPNDPSDDIACVTDADCGTASSGRICVDSRCVDGCRTSGGNGCPSGQMCTVSQGEVGMCEPEPEPDAGVPPPPPPPPPLPPKPEGGEFGGGGCSCSVTGGQPVTDYGSALWVTLALGFVATRRRRVASRR